MVPEPGFIVVQFVKGAAHGLSKVVVAPGVFGAVLQVVAVVRGVQVVGLELEGQWEGFGPPIAYFVHEPDRDAVSAEEL